ncbi:hypothetical protein XELAEV_180350432mg, partial [Xenopus laevis]
LDFNGFYTERLKQLSSERNQKSAPLLGPAQHAVSTK